MKNKKTKEYLIKNYYVETRNIEKALEIIKQQMIILAKKISKYEA